MGVDLSNAGGDGRKQYRKNSSEEGHRHSSSSLFQAQGTPLFTLLPFLHFCYYFHSVSSLILRLLCKSQLSDTDTQTVCFEFMELNWVQFQGFC